jgi:FLVCR family MFS transporter 7
MFPYFLLTEACLVTLISILTFIGYHNTPPSPPSASAQIRINQAEEKKKMSLIKQCLCIFQDLKIIFSRTSLWFLLLSFGFGIGAFNALSTVIAQLTQPYGYTAEDSTIFGAALLATGLVTAGIFGAILDKFKLYKSIMLTQTGLLSVSLLFMTLIIQERSVLYLILLTVSVGCIGGSGLPYLPCGLEASMELAFPAEEGTVAGLMILFTQFFGIIGTLIATWLLNWFPETAKPTLFVLFLFAVLSFVLLIPLWPNYKRMEEERKEKVWNHFEKMRKDQEEGKEFEESDQVKLLS